MKIRIGKASSTVKLIKKTENRTQWSNDPENAEVSWNQRIIYHFGRIWPPNKTLMER